MSIVQKITTGFVIQDFDAETGKCVEQHFIAGDDCVWEDNESNPGSVIDEPTNAEYFPYNMEQPNSILSLEQGDLVTVLELARVALADAETYDHMVEKLDISDEYVKELQEKLHKITEGLTDV